MDRFMKKPVVKNLVLLSLSHFDSLKTCRMNSKKKYQNENYILKFDQDDQIFAIKDGIFLNKKRLNFARDNEISPKRKNFHLNVSNSFV